MLDKVAFANQIVTALDNEVEAHMRTDSEGNRYFDPEGFNEMCYLQVIYNYIKDNTEIRATYSGVNTETGIPDPAVGPHTFVLSSVGGTIPATTLQATQKLVIGPTKEAAKVRWNAWFAQLQLSLAPLVVNPICDSLLTLVATPTPVSVIPTQVLINFTNPSDRVELWKDICDKIIEAVKSCTFVLGTGANSAFSSTGPLTVTNIQ